MITRGVITRVASGGGATARGGGRAWLWAALATRQMGAGRGGMATKGALQLAAVRPSTDLLAVCLHPNRDAQHLRRITALFSLHHASPRALSYAGCVGRACGPRDNLAAPASGRSPHEHPRLRLILATEPSQQQHCRQRWRQQRRAQGGTHSTASPRLPRPGSCMGLGDSWMHGGPTPAHSQPHMHSTRPTRARQQQRARACGRTPLLARRPASAATWTHCWTSSSARAAHLTPPPSLML